MQKTSSDASLTVAVLARITPEQALHLDAMVDADGALASRPAAIRTLIDAARLTPPDAAEGKEVSASAGVLAAADLDRLIAAIDARTAAYNALAKQVRSAGTLANTLCRLGHQIVSYGRHSQIPVAAVERVGRIISEAHAEIARLAQQDMAQEEAIGKCPRR